MTQKILIDATRGEETRVAVLDAHSNLIDYDFEDVSRKQLKGNIYLAKVSRVEPSLQACFVDYGGNRQGFLAFSEIHPDYFQIPVADRQRLLDEAEEFEGQASSENADTSESSQVDTDAAPVAELAEGSEVNTETPENGEAAPSQVVAESPSDTEEEEDVEAQQERKRARFIKRMMRSYRIQEVIKKNQVMLVQVVKEERGNKGAAMTTYLSLAGRFSVLMPNTRNGGGVSRKIGQRSDRKKLKEYIESLGIPSTMSIIIRTAGAECTKAEIKRDYAYLSKVWDQVRQDTLKATAPALIYEEANLIKRAIRDMAGKDVEEILIEGAEGFRQAKAFLKMLSQAQAKKLVEYKGDTLPLFHKYGADSSLDDIYTPIVQLRSGGYIVINPTEALVSIDVNSGRATRERDIEKTALRTNLEAAEEIAKQLRLRDLSGLIVIDFIDMISHGNIRRVERAMRDALKSDRARLQALRISDFGLMEISRQRLRPSIQDSITQTCPVCQGIGKILTPRAIASRILHQLETGGVHQTGQSVKIKVPAQVALALLNDMRRQIIAIEDKYQFKITITQDESLISQPFFEIEGLSLPVAKPRHSRPHYQAPQTPQGDSGDNASSESSEDSSQKQDNRSDTRQDQRGGDRDNRRGRNRRRGGRGRNRNRTDQPEQRSGDTAGSYERPSTSQSSGNENMKAETPPVQSEPAKVEILTPPRVLEPEPISEPKALPENVQVVEGTPENPKRGWWRRSS